MKDQIAILRKLRIKLMRTHGRTIERAKNLAELGHFIRAGVLEAEAGGIGWAISDLDILVEYLKSKSRTAKTVGRRH